MIKNLLIDPYELSKFCNVVLPKLEKDEVLIAVLFARKKYGEITRSCGILDKLILKSSDPDYVIKEINKLAYIHRCYVDYKTGEYLTYRSMVIYIDILPRSCIKAFGILSKDYHNWIYQSLRDPNFDPSLFRRLDTKLFSAIARSLSRKPYILIDVDTKDEGVLHRITSKLKNDVVWISETRSGFHVIALRNEHSSITVHTEISGMDNVEIFTKQGQTPVPGTLQGGVLVKGIYP